MGVSSPVKISFKFHELGITRYKLEKLMGFEPGNAPDPIPEEIDNILNISDHYAEIKGGYVLLDKPVFGKNSLSVNNINFQTGKIVTHSLREAERLVLFIITAGKKFEIMSHRYLSGSDPMKGYVFDVLGSETVESTAEKMLAMLEQEMLASGQRTTNPYSPGYCGWPVTDQHMLFSFFPDNFCGISLSESSLMDPIKSVSGMAGIGPQVKKNPYSCQICDARNCIYRDKKILSSAS